MVLESPRNVVLGVRRTPIIECSTCSRSELISASWGAVARQQDAGTVPIPCKTGRVVGNEILAFFHALSKLAENWWIVRRPVGECDTFCFPLKPPTDFLRKAEDKRKSTDHDGGDERSAKNINVTTSNLEAPPEDREKSQSEGAHDWHEKNVHLIEGDLLFSVDAEKNHAEG